MPTFPMTGRRGQRGLAYVEILISVALLAVLLVPAMQALNAGINGSAVSGSLSTRQLDLRGKMEQVLSQPFRTLYAETYLPGGNTTASVSAAYSDAPGAANRRVVVFYRFDAATNALSSGDTGLLFVSVAIEGEGGVGALSTLVGRWW